MKYKIPFKTKAYITGSNKVLDLDKCVDLISNLTEDFTEPEPAVLEFWKETYFILYGEWNYILKKNARPLVMKEAVKDFNDRGRKAAKKLGIDFSEKDRISTKDIVSFQISVIESDPFLQGLPQQIMHDEASEKYNSVKSKAETFCKPGSPNKYKEIEDFFSLTHTLYMELNVIREVYNKHFKNFQYYRDVFKSKNLNLANGEIDFSEIRKIYKREFGSDEVYYLLPLGIIVIKVLTLNQLSSDYSSESSVKIGLDFEKKIAEIYERIGYKVSYTSASGDFGIDLIAESNSGRIGIQCKNHGANVGVDAVMQTHSGALYYDCKNSVVVSSSGFTKSAYEMASKLKVELLTIVD
ncbi:restriction endonuclease [Halomonas sp. BLK-85]